MSAKPTAPGIPEGFVAFSHTTGFIDLVGPFYWCGSQETGFGYGFHAEARHANPNGVIHGGALTAFVDTLMGHAVVHATGRMCATIALNGQFMAGAKAGRWLTGRAIIKRQTKTMVFLDGDVLDDGAVVYSATGIFKIFDMPAAYGPSGNPRE